MYRKNLCFCWAALFAIGVASMPNGLFAGDPVTGSPEEQINTDEIVYGEALPVIGTQDFHEKSATVPVVAMPQDDGSPRGPGSDNCAGATPAVDGLNAFDEELDELGNDEDDFLPITTRAYL